MDHIALLLQHLVFGLDVLELNQQPIGDGLIVGQNLRQLLHQLPCDIRVRCKSEWHIEHMMRGVLVSLLHMTIITCLLPQLLLKLFNPRSALFLRPLQGIVLVVCLPQIVCQLLDSLLARFDQHQVVSLLLDQIVEPGAQVAGFGLDIFDQGWHLGVGLLILDVLDGDGLES